MRPVDTSPEAWKVQMDLMRQMPPGEKLRRTFAYSALVRSLAEATFRQKHPQATEREVFLWAARHRLGADLFAQAYGNELNP